MCGGNSIIVQAVPPRAPTKNEMTTRKKKRKDDKQQKQPSKKQTSKTGKQTNAKSAVPFPNFKCLL